MKLSEHYGGYLQKMPSHIIATSPAQDIPRYFGAKVFLLTYNNASKDLTCHKFTLNLTRVTYFILHRIYQ
jgi:hypothetical protein